MQKIKPMINIQSKLLKEKAQSKMIIQVHDELVFDVVPSEKKHLENLVKSEMADAVNLKVPLETDVAVGRNWLEIS